MMKDDPQDSVEWLGIHLRVPSEWQIVRHSTVCERGMLAFVDRRIERLRMSWQSLEREPELGHMLNDQRSREQREHQYARLGELRGIHGWRGYTRTDQERRVTRAARFDKEHQRLLEVVLTDREDGQASGRQRRELLESITVTAKAEAARSVRAFQLSMQIPEGYGLRTATVRPADVLFEFRIRPELRKAKGDGALFVRRSGMASAWYDGKAKDQFCRDDRRVKYGPIIETQRAAHVAALAEGAEPTARILRLLGRGALRRSLLWHCEVENAVYRVSTVGRGLDPLLPECVDVTCCHRSDHG